MRDISAVGHTGVLTIATRGSGGAGEVLLSIRGGSESLLAWSDEPLPRGTAVLVIDVVSSRTVRVISCDDVGQS